MKLISALLIFQLMESCNAVNERKEFVAEQILDEATIKLNGKIEDVFPLFGPIKEMEWADGWNPEVIYSHSDDVEEYMIFKSKARFENESPYVWAITKYFPEQYLNL